MALSQTQTPTKSNFNFGNIDNNISLGFKSAQLTNPANPAPTSNANPPKLAAQQNPIGQAKPKMSNFNLKRSSSVSIPQRDPDPATQSGQINIEYDTPEAKKKIIMEEIPMSNVDFSRLFPK